eukprot:4979689-Pleurochrysis_carterae.AAC.10
MDPARARTCAHILRTIIYCMLSLVMAKMEDSETTPGLDVVPSHARRKHSLHARDAAAGLADAAAAAARPP